MPRKPRTDPPLLDDLDELIGKLREQIPAAIQQHDSTAIHQSRVSTRRLAAAIEVLKPILSKSNRSAFTGTLRKLRRRLGPLRDLDVMIDHLSEIRSVNLQPAIHWAQVQLQEQRDRQRTKVEKKVDPEKVLAKLDAWAVIDLEVSGARQAVDSLLTESLNLQLDAFVDHADGITGRQLSDPAMRDPHELRIAGKALRYSLEMAAANGHKLPAKITRSFKQMQNALGRWHDDVVLAERLMSLSLDELLPHHDATTQRAVLNLCRDLLSRATRSLATFSRIWNAQGEEITRTIRQSFPLTEPVDAAVFNAESPPPITLPKADPDPPGSTETPGDPAAAVSPPTEPSTA